MLGAFAFSAPTTECPAVTSGARGFNFVGGALTPLSRHSAKSQEGPEDFTPRKEPSSMLSGWVGMAVGGRHDFAHNHQRTPRGMARADFSSSYSRSCGHIGARNPCRQRRCQRGRRFVDDGPRYLRHCCNAGRLRRRKRPICSRGRLTGARAAVLNHRAGRRPSRFAQAFEPDADRQGHRVVPSADSHRA